MELYNISNLSYSYPGSDMNALSDISLKINKGEFYAKNNSNDFFM